jgi:predicted dehydrogenase
MILKEQDVKNELGIGIVGAGGFAGFAAKAFSLIPGVKIIAVTDINENAALQMGNELNIKVYHNNYGEFLQDNGIDLVYIATPPCYHYEQTRMALLAGRNVICEKPAALKTSEAEELQTLARSLQLLYVVNLMQRYNPLYGIVKRIITETILGNFVHGFFENYASDENLKKEHWFWEEKKSGGILIEHGVHFFDMFAGWLGEGEVINAIRLQRPGVDAKLVDRVQATILYRDGIVNFYHGFDQPMVLDRQEMRLTFERGDITLYEWIPVRLKLHGLLLEKDLMRLREIMRELTFLPNYKSPGNKRVAGRFANIGYDHHITFDYEDKLGKQGRYRKMLSAMLQDQWDWIRDRQHVRVVDDNNAVESIRVAEQATNIAQYYNSKTYAVSN